METPEYQIEKKENGTAEIFIYGFIGGWDIEDVTASAFVKEFKQLEQQFDRINVRINSPGGSLWEGLAIYNTIAQSQKDVHTYIDGIAYSMAGIIALAGKTVHAAESSMLMIHNASGLVVGNAKSMRTAADELDKYDQTIAQAIATKTGTDLQAVLGLYFDYQDHYFTAAEGLETKLIDVIEAQISSPVPTGIQNMKFNQVLNYYSQQKSLPEQSGILQSIVSLFRGTKQQPEATGKPKTAGIMFSQAELDERINAVDTKYQAQLFEAENNAEFWKKKAEEYGSQPGAMPTNVWSGESELSDEAPAAEEAPKHLFSEATIVSGFRARN